MLTAWAALACVGIGMALGALFTFWLFGGFVGPPRR